MFYYLLSLSNHADNANEDGDDDEVDDNGGDDEVGPLCWLQTDVNFPIKDDDDNANDDDDDDDDDYDDDGGDGDYNDDGDDEVGPLCWLQSDANFPIKGLCGPASPTFTTSHQHSKQGDFFYHSFLFQSFGFQNQCAGKMILI